MDFPTSPGVYRIVHLESGRSYVGSAINLRSRMETHFRQLRAGNHPNSHLQNSYNKYWEAAFLAYTVEHVSNPDHVEAVEQTYIDYYRRYTLYNKNMFATNWRGYKHTPDSIEKMSRSHKGKPQSAEQIRKSALARTGGKRTPEQKERIAAGQRGKKLSPEIKAALIGHGQAYNETKKRPIEALTPHGVPVYGFACISDAFRAGFSAHIYKCLKGGLALYRGLVWRYL